MGLSEVGRVLDVLAGCGSRCWIAGGWGVDALVGAQTRPHRDLDLLFDADREASVVAALEALGYVPETDQRPVRLELAAPGSRWVDLHPVVLDADGDGLQAGFDGAVFRYRVTDRAVGHLDGRAVACLSVAKQLELHRGYPSRAVGRHDVALLEALR